MDAQFLKDQFMQELARCVTSRDLEQLRVAYLGKKGKVAAWMADLRHVTAEQRPLLGQRINDLKQEVTEQLDVVSMRLEQQELEERLASESLDVTLPGATRQLGRSHVVLRVLHEAIEVLRGMGFAVQYGPDIESEYYNFEALNFPKDHPARDMQDTFYLQPNVVLRTHTSNTQVRIMEGNMPPIRVIAPGKCFRNEDISRRSHVTFHQIDGLYIDREVTFADLFDTLKEFFSKFFRCDAKMRFRPSYFPFVEPGVEVDVVCMMCEGQGCPVCKRSGWLEVAGAGMVHPEVLKSGGIDPEEYNGYAWGFGIERIAMLRYGIPDIRLFMENRLDFLTQF